MRDQLFALGAASSGAEKSFVDSELVAFAEVRVSGGRLTGFDIMRPVLARYKARANSCVVRSSLRSKLERKAPNAFATDMMISHSSLLLFLTGAVILLVIPDRPAFAALRTSGMHADGQKCESVAISARRRGLFSMSCVTF